MNLSSNEHEHLIISDVGGRGEILKFLTTVTGEKNNRNIQLNI